MKIEVGHEDVQTLTADSRGRVTLGIEHAWKTVTVALVDVEEED